MNYLEFDSCGLGCAIMGFASSTIVDDFRKMWLPELPGFDCPSYLERQTSILSPGIEQTEFRFALEGQCQPTFWGHDEVSIPWGDHNPCTLHKYSVENCAHYKRTPMHALVITQQELSS